MSGINSKALVQKLEIHINASISQYQFYDFTSQCISDVQHHMQMINY